METTKSIVLSSAGVISFAITLSFILLLNRKEKLVSEHDGKIRLSFGMLMANYIIGFSILNYKMLSVLSELIDSLLKLNSEHMLINVAKSSVMFLGLNICWIIICQILTKTLLKILFNNRDQIKELEANNYVYFLIKGVIFIGLILSLMPVFDDLLRTFFPEIEIPIYH